MDRFDETEVLLGQAIAATRSTYGPDHWRVGSSLGALGTFLMRRHRYRDAETPFRETLAVFETAIGPDHTWTATARGRLGACLVALGREREAESLIQASLRILEQQEVMTGSDWFAVTRIVEFLEQAGDTSNAAAYRDLLTEQRRPPGIASQALLEVRRDFLA